MARKEELKADDLKEAIRKGRGKTTIIAQLMECTPETIRNYSKRHKWVEKAIEQARHNFKEGLADKAEVKLEAAIMNGEPWAIRYTLATQAKDRGYIERIESHTVNIDVTDLSNEQLERIANGEDPLAVLHTIKSGG